MTDRRLLGAVASVLLAAGLLVQPASGDGTPRHDAGAPAARPSTAATAQHGPASTAPRSAAGATTPAATGGPRGRAEAPARSASHDAGDATTDGTSRGASHAAGGTAGARSRGRSTGAAAKGPTRQGKGASQRVAGRTATDRSGAPTDHRARGRSTAVADTPAAETPAAEPAAGAPPAVEATPAPGEYPQSGARGAVDRTPPAAEPPTAAPEQSAPGESSDGARAPAPPSQGVRETPTAGGATSPTPSTTGTPAGAPPAAPTPAAPAAPTTGGERPPNGTPSPATGRRPATSDGSGSSARSAGASAPDALPPRLDRPLVTPAGEALSRVRPAGAASTSQPHPGVGSIAPLSRGEPGGGDTTSTTEVLVWWASAGLAALGLLVLVLGANAVLARARTRRLERQRAILMEDFGLLQAALLPAVPSRLGALLTTVAYRPAEGPAAGGDFYDAFPLQDGRVGLLLGDISGHGRQALAQTTLVRFTVRAHLEAGLSPREALAISGRSLEGRLSDDFATVIAAVHDPRAGTLTYASAGHPPPIVVGGDGQPPVTASSAPPIGVGFPTGQRQTVLPMPPGTAVMIYSDGLLEARIDGVAVGPERLAAWLRELGPEATATALLDRVVARTDRVPDDLAAVLVHAAPGADVPATRVEQLKLDVLDLDGPDLEGFLVAAGVGPAERRATGRRASELLATTSGVVVEVRMGERPTVRVAPLGDGAGAPARPHARTR